MVEQVVRAALIEPHRLAGAHIAGEDAGRPFVVARPLLRVPRAGIAGAVEDQLGVGVVADPAPDARTTDLPRLRRPSLHAEVLAAVGGVVGLEARPNQDVLVWAGVERLPRDLAAAFVEGRNPAAHAHLATADADQDFAVG